MPTMRHGRWLRSTPACLVGVLSLTGAIAGGQPPSFGPSSSQAMPAAVSGPARPPADGWRLGGQVVALDEGSAVARNAVGFGAGNKSIGIDVGMADPATANGQPFFILDTSDRGRLTPGTVPLAAVAGFNPVVVAGKLVASNSGIADITQQQRLAGEIAAAVSQAINQHVPPQAR